MRVLILALAGDVTRSAGRAEVSARPIFRLFLGKNHRDGGNLSARALELSGNSEFAGAVALDRP